MERGRVLKCEHCGNTDTATLRISPTQPLVTCRLCNATTQLGRTDWVRIMGVRTPEERLANARVLIEQERYDVAREQLEALSEEYADSAETWYLLAMVGSRSLTDVRLDNAAELERLLERAERYADPGDPVAAQIASALRRVRIVADGTRLVEAQRATDESRIALDVAQVDVKLQDERVEGLRRSIQTRTRALRALKWGRVFLATLGLLLLIAGLSTGTNIRLLPGSRLTVTLCGGGARLALLGGLAGGACCLYLAWRARRTAALKARLAQEQAALGEAEARLAALHEAVRQKQAARDEAAQLRDTIALRLRAARDALGAGDPDVR